MSRSAVWLLVAAASTAILAGIEGLVAETGAPAVYAAGVLDAADFSHELAPGMVVQVHGQNFSLAPSAATGFPLPAELEGVSLEVSDRSRAVKAPLLSVTADRVVAQIPFGLSGPLIGVRVKTSVGASDTVPAILQARAPRILMTSSGGAMATHADGRMITAAEPAAAGEIVVLFCIGLGDVDPAVAAGIPADNGGGTGALHRLNVPVSVQVGVKESRVLFAGLAPGHAGLYQINFQVPEDVQTGPLQLAVEADAERSQPNVYLPVSAQGSGREHFISPNGTPEGDGTADRPWDLVTALAHPRSVRPGDTLWLTGGVYGDGTTIFTSTLSGEPGKPMIVRQRSGERARINGGLDIEGDYSWYWGFEVFSSVTDRTVTDPAPHGFIVNGRETKFINLVVHDTATGFGLWTPAENAEVYGCLIYNNGYQGVDRGHGHGIYTQNLKGTKLINDNIIFNQFAVGIHAYGSDNASVEGYGVNGNIVFNNGSLSAGGNLVDNILFAVGGSLGRIRVENNYTYMQPSAGNGYSRLGWVFSDVANRDIVVRNNFWIGGSSAVELWRWNLAEFTGNTAYSDKQAIAALSLNPGQKTGNYFWDRNTYFGSDLFRLNGSNQTFPQWQTATGMDSHSTVRPGRPSGVWLFVRPNRYEPGRGHIAIYNWDLRPAVDVDLSAVLTPGTRFEIRDAQNYFGAPVVSGTWDGKPVSVPTTGLRVAMPAGEIPSQPQHTGPEFAALVVLSQ